MPERKPCRCLLEDSRPDLQQVVADVLATIHEDLKAPEAVYHARLDACLACLHLRDGTCAVCGCYVEVRAARRTAACPDIPPRWNAL